MTSASAFISDGYTQKCYFKGVPRIYSEMRFSFRPIPSSEARALLNGFAAKSAKEQEQIANAAIIRHLKEWDLKDINGQPVELTKENLCKIKLPLKERLFDTITGYNSGDDDPLEEDNSKPDEFDYDALVGNEPQDSPEEADAKN